MGVDEGNLLLMGVERYMFRTKGTILHDVRG